MKVDIKVCFANLCPHIDEKFLICNFKPDDQKRIEKRKKKWASEYMENGQESQRVQKKIPNDVSKKYGPQEDVGIPINANASEDMGPKDYIADSMEKNTERRRNEINWGFFKTRNEVVLYLALDGLES